MKKTGILKNIFNVTSSNIIVLGLGVVMTLILPMKLSVENYGYWQLFLLYVSYSGLILFGFTDGIHLRYAGVEYKNLKHKLFRTEFFWLIFYNILIMFLGLLFLFYFDMEPNKKFVFIFVLINMVLFNVHGFFVHISQISFKFKEYSIGIAIERIMLVSLIIATFALPIKSFKFYIILDSFCKLIAIIYFIQKNQELVFGDRFKISEVKSEIGLNIKSGFFLTATSIVSMMISNYIKFFVEGNYGITEFSHFAFATSMMSLALQAVLSISTVLFPMIKKVNEKNLKKVYFSLRSLYSNISGILLITYFIAVIFIDLCIPKYKDVLDYLFILFPILLFDIKNSMLLLIFYKAYRFEKETLKNNVIGLIIMIVLTFVSSLWSTNMKLLVMAYLFSYFLLTEIAELRLFKLKKWEFRFNSLSNIYIILFLLINYIFNIYTAFFIYLIIILIILIINLKNIKNEFILILSFLDDNGR